MNQADLIEALEEIAVLLELDGANSFRCSAYSRAARALADFDGDLSVLAEEGRLTDIDGIGKGLAEKITEFHDSGRIEELDELRARIPAGLVAMLQIQGFGPKKARAVNQELGIETVAELKAACEDGRLAALKGFGAKTALKILEGIATMAKFSGRRRLDVASIAAGPILHALRNHPAVIRADKAGSLRRHRETIGDLDFVVSTNSPEEVMDFFVAIDEVQSVLGKGETKSSVLLSHGIQADLRCVSDVQYPFALAHFTGSKEHNTRMRTRAKERGLKLNEYGLFPEGSEESLPARNEADIYTHLGLQYVPPELREDMGELEAAEAGTLPTLITAPELRGLMHMHTHYSDGKPTLKQYAQWAADSGMQWMAIADHSQSLTVANGLNEARVRQQWAEIDAVNREFAGRVRLIKGIESDILLDGSLDYPQPLLDQFEWIVASVHSHFNLTEAEQTRRIIRAMENPATTVLGHLTGRLLLAREGYAVDQRAVIREAARLGVAIEINANPMRLDMDWRLVHFAIEQGVLLCISPDAHILAGLTDVAYGVGIARKGWVQPRDLLNCLSADDFLAFAKARRS